MKLEADPGVGVQVGTRRFFPLYDDYAQKADREIPIVLFTLLDGPRKSAFPT